MTKVLRALSLAGFCSVQAVAGGAPIRLANPGLSIFQPQVGALGVMLAAPAAPSLSSTLSLNPSLTPAIASLQPLPQLQTIAAPISPVVQAQEKPPVMPALETLAEKTQVQDQAAAPISSFYDGSVIKPAPADSDRSAPVAKDPVTNLYGVSPEQLKAVISILRKHYGSNLLDLAAIGSRAKGKASALKNFRPPTGYSDLDLAPLLRNMGGTGPDSFAIEKEIEAATGLPIQLHGVLSAGETRYTDAVPFYGGGYETYEWFSSGDAVRIAIDP